MITRNFLANSEQRSSRREAIGRSLLVGAAVAGLGDFSSQQSAAASPAKPVSTNVDLASIEKRLRYCLNTSTINGSVVPVREQLKIAAKAGYQSVELWLRDIEKFTKEAGQLSDLRKQLDDLGLGLDSAIAFGQWIAEDAAVRAAGLDQCKRDMEIVRTLGGRRIAAPPAGATNLPKLNLDDVAHRYRALLEVGKAQEVTPQLELWGFSKNLSTLGEVLYVAAAANHEESCVLLDIYHLYKGGNDFSSLSLIPASNMRCLHMNDYPATPKREEIADKDRVYPLDGVAPTVDILKAMFKSGFEGTLSLELFNRSYWEQPADLVAKTGLEKMKLAVQRAIA
jgi:2-keto-myo-inositol isomerase